MQVLKKHVFVAGTVLGLALLAHSAMAQKGGSTDDGSGTCMSTVNHHFASCGRHRPWYTYALCAAQWASDGSGCAIDAVAELL